MLLRIMPIESRRPRPQALLTRRRALVGSGALIAAACSPVPLEPPPDSGRGRDASAPTDGTSPPTDAASNQGPRWSNVPDQEWVVGVPVRFDLASFCTDADGDTLTFSLTGALPPGLTLVGSVITGTPTAESPAASFQASADDGRG